ncbi:hypothetical protein BGZ67_005403 [Mortierella alpina]|nr:hypothetical protein BGZ67_005403 [Mortierella alpina]
MRGSQTRQLEPEWTPLSSKSPAETLEPAYLRPYLSKEPLCPGFDPNAYANLPSRLSEAAPTPHKPVQQGTQLELGQTRDPNERLREYQPYAPQPSTTFLAPSVPQPASSYEIRLVLDRLSSLDGSISSMQQRLDEHERKAQQAETVLQKQITAMLDQRDKELLGVMQEQTQTVVDSVRDADGDGGVGERILQHVGQLGQEAREAHLELHEDLKDRFVRAETVEKKLLSGLQELKDEMRGSTTEIDRLRSVVSQQSQMLGLIVEQHRTSMTQFSTLQICMNSCLAERRNISRSHQEFGVVRMLSPPEDVDPFDAVLSQKSAASLPSPISSKPPSEPEEAVAEAVEPTGTDRLTRVSVTYATQDEGSVTDVIHVARVKPSPAKKARHSNRRSHPRSAGIDLTAQMHQSKVSASVKKTKLPQKAQAPVTSRRTRLQDRKQQEQLNFVKQSDANGQKPRSALLTV